MYHKILIVGNLGKDPEMRYTPSGQAVTSFSVAANRQYTASDGQQVKETIWFRVSAWGRQAEACNQYLQRGSRVLVEGRLSADPATGAPRIWTRQDGTPAANYEMTANSVQFLGGRGEGGAASYPDAPDAADVDADGIPF